MSKIRLALIVLVTVLLVGTTEWFAQTPGGAGGTTTQGSLGSIRAGGAPQQVPVTEEDRTEAQDLAKKLLAMHISETIDTIAKNTIDGTAGGGINQGGRSGVRSGPATMESPYLAPPVSKADMEKLVSVFQAPDSTRMQKSDALRKLSVVGTPEIVPAVAPLLGDPELSHMARYALEPIADPKVDTAFREALGKVQGRPLIGIIGSLGVRRDAQSVGALAGLLQNSDPAIVHASALALGNIGNTEAARALESAVAKAPVAQLPVLSEGLFRCAESLSGQRHEAAAVGIYDRLLKLNASSAIRTAALRGAILGRQADGLPLLRRHLQGSDPADFVAAIGIAQEMTSPGITQALTETLAGLSKDEDKIRVIGALGKRGDVAAVPVLLSLAQTGSVGVRLAAIGVLPQFTQADAVPVLLKLLDAEEPIAAAARAALTTIPGREADAAAMAMLSGNQTKECLIGIEIVAGRGLKSAIPELLRMSGSHSEARVRRAALKAASGISGSDQLPVLVQLALKPKSPDDLDTIVGAIRSTLVNVEDKAGFTQSLLQQLGPAQPAQKGVLFQLLSINGGTEALGAVRSAVDSPDPQVHAAALRALTDWPDFTAARPLIEIAAKSSTSLTDSVLALKGGARLIRSSYSTPLSERVPLCLAAYDSARRDEERREVVSVMGTLRSAAIGEKLLEIAAKNPGLRTEAGTAAGQVATSLFTGRSSSGRSGRP